jgi:hypothetical protein
LKKCLLARESQNRQYDIDQYPSGKFRMNSKVVRMLLAFAGSGLLVESQASAGATSTWLFNLANNSEATLVQNSAGAVYGAALGRTIILAFARSLHMEQPNEIER